MDFATLPTDWKEFSTWTWDQIAPYYDDLVARDLTTANVEQWLADWTSISALLDEVNTRYTVITTANTADEESERRYTVYLDQIVPAMMAAEQRVKQKLLDSGLHPQGFEQPLKKLRAEAALYREANVPLQAEHRKLGLEYEKIAGARNVTWEGREIPALQLFTVLEEPDRERRERAWRLIRARTAQDSPALSDLWRRLIGVRARIAANAGFDSFRAYRWQQLFRFDYSPEDAKRFHTAIEEVAVPAANRIFAERRERLGVSTLRPWDVDVDTANRPALHPYDTIEELETKTSNIFRQVEPDFGGYFETMRSEGLLDLDSRKNKAPGGYSLTYTVTRRPVIYSNSVGAHEDVQTLLHEGGHAFHAFEAAHLPYLQQRIEQMTPIEFAEVASMSMELLGGPYLTKQFGGFYNDAEAARARTDHLAGNIVFWPYMAMIDALQHWIYEHQDEAADIERVDEVWAGLEDRFRPSWDWSGLEQEKRTFWRRQGHVWVDPFYYVEYGMAQLGAVQVWGNSLRDPSAAVAAYRHALSLGATVSLPDLYTAAGARFAFDADTLRAAVELMERVRGELEPVARG
ncbi:MAG: M3 family oligoendopeptidase [Ktedonobacterales bacterium]